MGDRLGIQVAVDILFVSRGPQAFTRMTRKIVKRSTFFAPDHALTTARQGDFFTGTPKKS